MKKLTSQQSRAIKSTDQDLRITEEGEVWVTRDGKRILINRRGKVVFDGKKYYSNR